MLADLMISPEASLFGLQMATFLMCPQMVFSLYVCTPHISFYVQISFSYKDTSQIGLGPILI